LSTTASDAVRSKEQRHYDFRLVICLERFWPARGGVERYALGLASWFGTRVPVTVVTAVREKDSLRDELIARSGSSFERSVSPAAVDVLTVGLSRSGRLAFRVITGTERLIHKLAPGHYHHTRWLARGLTAGLLSRSLKRTGLPNWQGDRVVIHAMGPGELSEVGVRLFPDAALVVTPFIHPGFWWEDHQSSNWFRRCDRVVALGVEDFRTCERVGIPPERMSVVPTLSTTNPVPSSASAHRDMVVFIGVARPYKGVDLFIDAFEHLKTRLTGIKFVWAGTIPDSARDLVARAKASGIVVCGEISEDEKRALLKRAICLCLPSATEIAPYAILEAWDNGAPVVATNDPYFREFVGGGGLFIERNSRALAEAIKALVQDPDLARRCVKSGQDLLKRHDPDVVGPQLAMLYRLAVDRKVGPQRRTIG
jgi:glycosyltransferase involved in cell wall biosynthesis